MIELYCPYQQSHRGWEYFCCKITSHICLCDGFDTRTCGIRVSAFEIKRKSAAKCKEKLIKTA